MCDGEMKLKTAAEKLACEKQIMASCWSTEGAECFKCMDEHAAKHREAPRMCSEFQLANFCAFYSWGKTKTQPPAPHHVPQIPPGEVVPPTNTPTLQVPQVAPPTSTPALLIQVPSGDVVTPTSTPALLIQVPSGEVVTPTSTPALLIQVPSGEVVTPTSTPAPPTVTKTVSISSACEGEVKEYCGKDHLDIQIETIDFSQKKNERRCLSCVKEHIKRLSSAPSVRELSLCALYDLAQMCDITTRGTPKVQAVACENQVKGRCKGMVASPACKQCVQKHTEEIDAGLKPDNTCSHFQLQHFCYFYGQVERGYNEEGAAVGMTPKLVKITPTAAPTSSAPPPSSCEEEVKVYCGSAIDFNKKINSRQCLDCVKEHIERITEALKPATNAVFDGVPLCSLRELGALCHVSMEGQSNEETPDCEHELKRFCGHQQLMGKPCMECVKTRLEKIDGGLIGEGMCSEYQIKHFCFADFTSAGIIPNKAEITKYDAEQAAKTKKVVKEFETCDAELVHHCSGVSSPFGKYFRRQSGRVILSFGACRFNYDISTDSSGFANGCVCA
jgi:hypothetical protein